MKKLIVLFIALSIFTNCMVIGSVAGGKKTTSENEVVLNSKGTINQSKSALKQVLYQKGYYKLSENENTVKFQRNSSLISELIFSKTKMTIIIASFSEENIKIEIVQNGNFKNGTDKKVVQTFLEIKNEYEEVN
jgi:hypothetical protein